ncbi:MAG: flagellar motor switch protein FliM [Bryobacterales bacterium]|nr:flagellar motor switch protein FliM [Acidobacteriota bacterium]MCB9384909.1 flagellar motor switch protein FliM [Bryobacterales bacterium]
MSTQLTQDEIDRLFRSRAGAELEDSPRQVVAAPYDFRRPDRIPKEQLRSIHLMHDFLARNLASSLGAYLRAYVTVSLVSVEQISFGEFLQYLPAPTCISSVAMPQMDGSAVLELNPTLVMPMLDVLLGGTGRGEMHSERELTEIEQSIVEGVLRIILQDLRNAWAPVAKIDFKVDAIETQPQLMQMLSSNEAIVAIGFEITMGESRGMMNFGVPSVLVKMVGQKFEQQWSIRRRSSAEADRDRVRKLAMQAPVRVGVRALGAQIPLEQVLRLEVGDVLSLETPVRRPVQVLVEGIPKYEGDLVAQDGFRAAEVLQRLAPARMATAEGEA